MKAEILDRAIRFEVEPESGGNAPERIVITVRPCWRKPAERFDLEYVWEDLGVAYYEIAESEP